MRFLAFHGGQAPTGAFTQSAIDGTHNASLQAGVGYPAYGPSVNYREPHAFPHHSPATLAPSGIFSQTAIDGTHNASLQAGAGYWDSNYLLNDYPIWYRTLAAIAAFAGFFYTKFHGVYLFPMAASLSFAGLVQRKLSRLLIATSSFSGLFRRGRIFLANLSFSAFQFAVHTYQRIFIAALFFATSFLTHWHNLYSFLLTSSLSFSGLIQRLQSKIFSATAYFNIIPPSSVTGLQLWLKADSINQADGTNVTNWADSSGNNFNATVSSGSAPIYKVNIVNGRPVVRFAGAGVLKTPNTGINQPDTLICVANANVGSTYATFLDAPQSGPPRQMMRLEQSTGHMSLYAGSGPVQGSNNRSGAFHIFTGVIPSGGVATGYVDGVQEIAPTSIGTQGVGVANIGGDDWFGSSVWLNGDIAEMLIYSHDLTTAERNLVEGYLGSKYAISGFVSASPNLTKLTNRILSAVSSFSAFFNALKIGFNQLLLTASLLFSGSFGHIATLARTVAAALSFSASFIGKVPIKQLLTAIASFSAALTSLKPIKQLLTAILSFSAFLNISILKLFQATLSFVGLLIKFHNTVYFVVLQSTLSFYALIYNPIGSLFLNINAIVHSLGQMVHGIITPQFQFLNWTTAQPLIATTPTIVNLGSLTGKPVGVLYIKNLDQVNSVTIDTSSSFINFPQLVKPNNAVCLSLATAPTIYAKASPGPAMIQVIGIGRKLG